MATIYLDFETRSHADLRKTGAWRYAESPSTDILCLAYAINDEPVELVIDPENSTLLEPLRRVLDSDDPYIVEAHNAFFEQAIWHNIMHKRYGWPDIPTEQWRCSAAKAAAHALPRGLGDCGRALDLPTTKDEEGRGVMLRLSKPRRPSAKNPDPFWEIRSAPERFKKLFEYCVTDVQCERAISKYLRDLNPIEQKVWELDQRMNRQGITVDMELVDAALAIADYYKTQVRDEVESITGGEVTKLTQRDRLLKWINEQGVRMPTDDKGKQKMDKAAVLEALSRPDLPESVYEVLTLRQEASKTSTAKYQALKDAVCSDGRLRDVLMYHGASTGRWAGKIVQMQNIPRGNLKDVDACIFDMMAQTPADFCMNYEKPMDALSSCLRGAFIAGEGKQLVVADYSSIEARVLVWLAGDAEAVARFEQGVDTYKDMASLIYTTPIDQITKDQRQLGKQAVLGCGYGMGWKKFKDTCLGYGMDVHDTLAERAVNAYREKYESVKQFWYDLENAAIQAVRTKKVQTCGKIFWAVKGSFLFCKLPSGRMLAYYHPRLKPTMTPWGEERMELRFMGVNSVTRQWQVQSTYGGKLVENVTQAVARDIMAEAMLRVDEAGFDVLLSVHDELITEIPEETYIQNPVEYLENLMCIMPDWGRDDVIGNIPIAAEGWNGKRYKK